MARAVHIQLGRNGDLILLLPCWRKLFEDTGEKPVVLVSREFCGVLHGASYVQAEIVNGNWYQAIPDAKALAAFKYGGFTVTQCHGLQQGCDMSAHQTFGETMWAKAGFAGKYGTLPLVFDRRNREREAALVKQYARHGKPMVLFNFAGNSSPLPCSQELRHRLRRWDRRYTMVNLAAINAERIYDLLGLYDAAAGLITIDTSTLHLAAASTVPTLSYLRGGWNSAIAKPGSVKIGYDEAHAKLEALDQFVQSLGQRDHEPLSLLHEIRNEGPGHSAAQFHRPGYVETAAVAGNPRP